MSYSVKVNKSHLRSGATVHIKGLKPFKNGSTRTVDDEEHDLFRRVNATIKTDKEGVTHTELGPTLLQASKTMDGVEVESDDSKKSSSSSSSSSSSGGGSSSSSSSSGGSSSGSKSEGGDNK
jgi:uncharacterized membrane protein YgcG